MDLLLPYFEKHIIEAGTDEAGRGCLAGPVVAAAVILPSTYKNEVLRDSKKLSARQREDLYESIKVDAISYSVAMVSNVRIDEVNILNASLEAMHLSLDGLDIAPEHIIVDGNRFKPYKKIPFRCFVKGDDKFYSIAAASILAKVERDRYMAEMAEKFPEYGWDTNKGYPTVKHREAIKKSGPCPLHRMTFRLTREQMELF